MEALTALLSNLQGSLESAETRRTVDQDYEIRKAMDGLQGLIRRCGNTCGQVKECLIPYIRNRKPKKASIEGTNGDKKGRPVAGSSSSIGSTDKVVWFFKRKDVFQRVFELQRTKALFSDAMGSLTLYVLQLQQMTLSNSGKACYPTDIH